MGFGTKTNRLDLGIDPGLNLDPGSFFPVFQCSELRMNIYEIIRSGRPRDKEQSIKYTKLLTDLNRKGKRWSLGQGRSV